MSDDELVLGAERTAIGMGEGWRGVRTTATDAIARAAVAAATYRRRGEVEDDPAWKQLIPYLVLRDGPRVFLMRRTRGGGDPRLHERYSIGVGGHVNPGDEGIEGALEREWREECDAGFVPAFRLVGLLNDDSDPVGAVHLGFVYEADAEGRPVRIRETDKLSGSFASREELLAVRDRMETWSALVLDHLLATGRV